MDARITIIPVFVNALVFAAGCGGAPTPEPEPVGETTAGDVDSADREIWKAGADLDGDGTVDDIVVISSEILDNVGEVNKDERLNISFNNCAPGDNTICDGTLRVGAATHPLSLRAGYFGGLGVQVIDIDEGDKQRELLLTQRLGDREDPPLQFWVATYKDKKLIVTPLWHSEGYSSGDVKTNGKGVIRVVYAECPNTYTVDYTLKGQILKEGQKKEKQTRDPASCAG